MIRSYFTDIRENIIRRLNKANYEICVAVCWFTNEELFEVLCRRLGEGISISLIVLNDSINNGPKGLDFQKFIDLGGKFYYSGIDNPVHNKYCIIDNRRLINGSYNWTNYAENRNRENITVIQHDLTVRRFYRNFKELTETYEMVTSVKDVAITESQASTIIENARIAGSSEVIIKNSKSFDGSEIKLKSSLGAGLKDDKFHVLIPGGGKIPNTKSYIFTTAEDNQTLCKMMIRSGENSVASENQSIGDFDVIEVPPMDKGKPGIITTFHIDTYGLLTVTVKVRESGKVTIHKYNIEHLIG
jgi:hypothetical protein